MRALRNQASRRHALIARLLAIAGLVACAVAAAESSPGDITDPLTPALVACALFAAVAYVDFEDTMFIDASIVPLLLSAIFLGPAPTFLVALIAEAGAWARQRYRISAALINAFATAAPSVAVAKLFENFDSRTGLDFYVAVVGASTLALSLNLTLLISLLSLLDGKPVRSGFRQVLRVFPAFALNVGLVVAAANVYVNVGLAAVIFVLAVILAFTYLLAQVFLARVQAVRLGQLATSRQHLAAQVLSAEDRERNRLANALHDGPLQDLLVARQDLGDVSSVPSDTADRVDRILSHAIGQLRDVVSQLHPAVLESGGLLFALEALARDQAQRAGIKVHIDLAEDGESAPSRVVYFAARELVTNAARHARAENLWIRTHRDGGLLKLAVEDDGAGLSPDRRRDALAEGHIGLASIEDRVDAVGGSFTLEPRRGGGTRCLVEIPTDQAGVRELRSHQSSNPHELTRVSEN